MRRLQVAEEEAARVKRRDLPQRGDVPLVHVLCVPAAHEGDGLVVVDDGRHRGVVVGGGRGGPRRGCADRRQPPDRLVEAAEAPLTRVEVEA